MIQEIDLNQKCEISSAQDFENLSSLPYIVVLFTNPSTLSIFIKDKLNELNILFFEVPHESECCIKEGIELFPTLRKLYFGRIVEELIGVPIEFNNNILYKFKN